MFEDSLGKTLREPEANPEAQILVNHPRKPSGLVKLMFSDHSIIVSSPEVEIRFNKNNSLFNIKNRNTDKIVVEEAAPVSFEKSKTILTLKGQPAGFA